MSEIAALQTTDRARPLPPGLRRQAYAMLMDLPAEVSEVAAAEEPNTLPPRLARTAFATLMEPPAVAGQSRPQRRHRRPMILRLVAASLAVALPATALVVAAQIRAPRPSTPVPFAFGPVYEDRIDPGGKRIKTSLQAPPAVEKRTAGPVSVHTRRGSGSAGKERVVQRTRPPRRPAPSPPRAEKDLVTTVLDQVKPITDLACGAASAVLPVCAAEQKTLPILGSSG